MTGTPIETTVRTGAPGDHMRRPLNCGLDNGHLQAPIGLSAILIAMGQYARPNTANSSRQPIQKRKVAPIERCFATLKTELVYQTKFPTRKAAIRELFAEIEGYYNRLRLHFASATSRQSEPGKKPFKSNVH
jgi:hypothetical protein